MLLRRGSSFEDLDRKIKEFVVATYQSDDYVPVLRPFDRCHLMGEMNG